MVEFAYYILDEMIQETFFFVSCRIFIGHLHTWRCEEDSEKHGDKTDGEQYGWEAYDAPNKKWSSAMILNTSRKYIFFTHNTSRGHAFPLICSEKIHGTEIDKDDTV